MVKNSQNVTITFSTGAIIKVILFGLLLTLLYVLRDLVLILLTAIVIASAIEPAAKWFMRYRIPRVPAVIAVYTFVVGFVFGIFYLFVPAILNDALGLFRDLPQYLNSITLSNPFTDAPLLTAEGVSEGITAANGISLESLIADLRNSLTNLSEGFLRTVSTVFGGIFSFILIIVFSFYLAVQETGIDDFLRIVTPVEHQSYIINLWKRSQRKIGLWMQGQLVLGLIIGVLTYLALTIFGVPYALLLAILAAMFEIIPIFGPILAAIPAVIIGFLTGGPSLGLIVVFIYVIIQQFENHLIYPLVVKKVVGVPPLLVIIALIIGATLAGFLGIILSVPVAAAVQEFITDIQKSKAAKLAKHKQA